MVKSVYCENYSFPLTMLRQFSWNIGERVISLRGCYSLPHPPAITAASIRIKKRAASSLRLLATGVEPTAAYIGEGYFVRRFVFATWQACDSWNVVSFVSHYVVRSAPPAISKFQQNVFRISLEPIRISNDIFRLSSRALYSALVEKKVDILGVPFSQNKPLKVVAETEGSLNTCSTRFLWEPKK